MQAGAVLGHGVIIPEGRVLEPREAVSRGTGHVIEVAVHFIDPARQCSVAGGIVNALRRFLHMFNDNVEMKRNA